MYTKKGLEEMTYTQLQKLAKQNEVKANGKKDELIARLATHFGGTTTTKTTATSKSVLSKKKKRDQVESEPEDDEDDDEEEEDGATLEIEKPIAPIKKSSKPAAINNKKQKVVQEEQEDVDDDDDDHDTVLQKSKIIDIPTNTKTTTATTKATTTTTTTSSNGADLKLVGPFEECQDDVKKWIRDGSVAYYIGEVISRPKIASFDMDSTLVINPSGKTHAVSKDDWDWWNKCVPGNLKNLYNDGYQVVIFTNQGGIKSGSQFDQTKFNQITQKICILEKELGIPLVAFIACADDAKRKPNKAMWEMMCELCTDGKVQINETESFYCGDAAGRPEGWRKGAKKDFSNSDLGFAMSVNIRFETPETYFLGEEPFVLAGGGSVVDSLIPKAPTTGKRFEGDEITNNQFEIVVSVGFPASGKSTFARKYFAQKYEIVNQDTLKTKEKCIKAAEQALKEGKSVIIDNTNGSKDIRAVYINLAKKYNASARCLLFTTPRDLAEHLNYYRERTQDVKHIPSMVYNIFNKNYVEPSVGEGFKSVTKINFVLELEEKDKQQYFIPNPKAKAK